MRKRSRRLAAWVMAVGVSVSLTGCGSPEADQASAKGSPAHVGIIFTQAGLGGNSFNDLALEGVKRAARELGITYDQVEPKSVADEEIIQDEMASSGEYDLIICVGDEQVDALNNVASVYTEQHFALLDATSQLPNVASYSCKAQEGEGGKHPYLWNTGGEDVGEGEKKTGSWLYSLRSAQKRHGFQFFHCRKFPSRLPR